MPTRSEPWPPGTPCWVELAVPDVTAATEFYRAVFDWTFVDTGAEYGHYTICQVDGRAAAAISPVPDPSQPSVWTVYLATDDADATAKSVTENGGRILSEPMDVPGNGRFALAADPSGATFGLWQSAGMTGAQVYGEPGSLVWTDVRSTDPDAARAFYAAVFGYRYEPVEGAPGDYTMFTFDGARDGESLGGVGGMMDEPAGTGSYWMSTFIVADADAAAGSARSAGGSVRGEPFDTPYGRMVTITDPSGASFIAVGLGTSG